MDLSRCSNGELLSCVRRLVGEERQFTAKLVAYLGEVEDRRLHLVAGFPSMFAFCTKELGMSENEAFRRLTAARLGRRFPMVHSLLASGAVHLSALELVRERLTSENHVELLGAISGKSKNEILALLAVRFPKPDVPTTIRKLPSHCIEPLSEERYRVEFTASPSLREKLELCRDLMSHANPSRDLGVVVERAMDLLLAELEKNRLGRTNRPRRERHQSPEKSGPVGRRITSATRRQVFERDGARCTYVSPDGRRCDARAFLEIDHVEPHARGGTGNAENLRIRCRAHNQLAAEEVFGREHMARCRHFVRQKYPQDGVAGDALEGEEAHQEGAMAPSALERVRFALKRMGFRDAEAKRAVALVKVQHQGAEAISIEHALREALFAATAGL